jgi:hypothetical protein
MKQINIIPQSGFNICYYEYKYRYGHDIKTCAKRKHMTAIDYEEQMGYLPDLCAIAKGILDGSIVSQYVTVR